MNIGSLTVSIVKDYSNYSTTIFMRSGTQEQRWRRRDINLNAVDIQYDFKLTIDALLKANYGFGDIAIDESIMNYKKLNSG